MKTKDCELASKRGVRLTAATQATLHGRCPGAYINQRGERKPCDCECHRGLPVPMRAGAFDGPLPVLHEPDPAEAPQETAQDTKKVEKRPPRSNNQCEHCGAPTGGRFAVGHDAKLKSELHRAAQLGDPEAWAELELRGWARLVDHDTIPGGVRGLGLQMSLDRGYAFVEERNRERQGISSESASS